MYRRSDASRMQVRLESRPVRGSDDVEVRDEFTSGRLWYLKITIKDIGAVESCNLTSLDIFFIQEWEKFGENGCLYFV